MSGATDRKRLVAGHPVTLPRGGRYVATRLLMVRGVRLTPVFFAGEDGEIAGQTGPLRMHQAGPLIREFNETWRNIRW